jgi:hypothetical protein
MEHVVFELDSVFWSRNADATGTSAQTAQGFIVANTRRTFWKLIETTLNNLGKG